MNNDVGFCKCLQSQYDRLTSIDEDTIYIVTDTGRIYKGSVLVGTSESGGGSSTTGTGLLAYDSFDKFISDFSSNSYVHSADIGTSTVCTYNKYTNTLQLWKDVSLSQTITITKPLKFDLNGYSVVLTGTAGITYSGQGQLYVYSSSSRSKISTSSTTKCIYILSDGSLKSENVDYESSFTLLDITESFDSSHSIEFSHSNITISGYGIYNQPSDTNNYCTAEFGFYFCNITFSKLLDTHGLRVSGNLIVSNCNFDYKLNTGTGITMYYTIFQECVGISSFLKITDCKFIGTRSSEGYHTAVRSYSANVAISDIQYTFDHHYNLEAFYFDIQGTPDSSQGTDALIILNNCYICQGILYISNSNNTTQKYKLELNNTMVISDDEDRKILNLYSFSSKDTVCFYNTRMISKGSVAYFNAKTLLDVEIFGGEFSSSSDVFTVYKIEPQSSSTPIFNIVIHESHIIGGNKIIDRMTGPGHGYSISTNVDCYTSDIKSVGSSELFYSGVTTKFNGTTSTGYSYVTSPILNAVFPINTIIPFYDNNNHSNYLGFKWERCLIGRVPVGIDSSGSDFSTIGNKVGKKEAPTLAKEGVLVASGGSNLRVTDYSGDADKSHGNIQPSEVVAFWKRIG